MNPIPLSKNALMILYADDILQPIDYSNDVRQLQEDINKVVAWMASQGLTPNHSKTQLLPHPLVYTVSVNGHRISPSSSVKYLRVYISSNGPITLHQCARKPIATSALSIGSLN